MKLEPVAAERPPFVYWTCLWLVGTSFAFVLIVFDLLNRDPGAPPGRDFANLYTAGKLALEGRAWQAFDVDIFRFGMRDLFGFFIQQNYSYPPHALLIAAPMALLPYWPAFALWTICSVAIFYWAAKPHMLFAPTLAVLTPAAALNLWNGHYGLLLGALWLLFFRYRGSAKAGALAAVMTIKPHMGLFIGIASLNSWRTLATAAAGTLALFAISVWLFEPASWYGFVGNTVGAQAEMLTRQNSEFYFRLMPSAYTAFGRGSVAAVLQLLFALGAVAILVRSRRMEPFALATATFLIVPYVFVYDMTVVCLGFALLLWRDWGVLSRTEKTILTLGFMAPNIPFVLPALAPPILLWALAIQSRRPVP
jgi:hypothetical protein